MEVILTLQQRVKNSISLGESHFREFKSAYEGTPASKRPRKPITICREIGEAIVAFANADGGELLIGVEDNGQITGLEFSEQDIVTMQNACDTFILDPEGLQLQHNRIVNIDGKDVLFLSVIKSSQKVYQLTDGRCMKRQDRNTIPASVERIQFERAEMASREYDRAFVDGASVNDLDLNLVQQVADGFLRGMSPEQYLQQVNLAEYGIGGLRIKRAALLLFAIDVFKWFPRCQVRIIKVDGEALHAGANYNVVSDEYVTGNIFTLLREAWERLRPFLSQKTVLSSAAMFEQVFAYPESACREALINAIAHRDYSISNPVTIYVYNNTLVFESPGSILSTVSLEDIRNSKGVHESRNSNIARVLRESNYMRELGEGMRRIYELFSSQELAAPRIESQSNSFIISMNHQSVYSPKELAWLNLYKTFDLDQYQKRIVIAGMNGQELSPSIIHSALGSDDRNLYDRAVTPLRIRSILKEIRSTSEAANIARKRNIKKQDVARFIVVTPDRIESTNDETSKVFVYNLPQDITRDNIISSMSLFGSIVSVDIPKDQDTKQPKGFAFVEYSDKKSALQAIAIKNITIGNTIAGIAPYRRK